MIHTLTLVNTDQVVPYGNLAMEEYLLNQLEEGECILYLWQNRHTVVIGRNQNPWKECRCESLKADGGFLARRLSGGGAVYHDLGNLNFTFLANREDYDIARQTTVVLNAMKRLGIHAVKTGRNDITVDGKKVSGHAYYETRKKCYHHGTIMVSVDTQNLNRYLQVDMKKLKSNGVDSVISRVGNLCDYAGISIGEMKQSLKQSFESEYGHQCAVVRGEDLRDAALEELEKKYASWEWLYGRKISFENTLDRKFDWGEVQICYNVKNGRLEDVGIYSDSLYPAVVEAAGEALRHARLTIGEILDRLSGIKTEQETEKKMISDIAGALCQSIM